MRRGIGWCFLAVISVASADMIGQSSCGKPVKIVGKVKTAGSNGDAVTGASVPEIYEQEVFGERFSAVVEGLPEGLYGVEMYFAEDFHKAPRERVFSIYAGDQVVEKDLDLYEKVGLKKEYKLSVPLSHKEDQILGPLEIRFQASVENAILNALIVKTTAGETVACMKAKDLQVFYDGPGNKIPVVNEPVVYTDVSLPFDVRVDDLVRRMSLYEKVTQMMNGAPEIERLGIPAYDYWNECLHGVARAGTATVFPQAIAMASMWDDAAMQTIADTIATEGRAKNNEARARNPNLGRYNGLTFWTPNINIFRDPRWGRGHETYGEDPYLTGRLGVSFIKGLQGDDPKYYKVMACAKHFAVHSGPESLRHEFNVEPPKRDLYETYLPQFELAVKEGKVANVMSAYNAVYGIPASASSFLLSDLLRKKWGFAGHVVSDCWAIRDVWTGHKYVKTMAEAAAVSVLAGTDLNCGSSYFGLLEAVEKKLLTEADVDVAIKRVLKARLQLGLFAPDKECAYLRIPASENNSPAHSQLALETARKSMVLLKNKGTLPLDKKALPRIAVIGPNADSSAVLLANYHGDAAHPITALQGIRAEVGSAAEVVYASGCPLGLKLGTSYSVENAEAKTALELAKSADVVIFIGGLDAESIEGEEMPTTLEGTKGGDRTVIELPSPQHDLLQALKQTGKPIVFVNMSGSAIAMPWEAENLDAILQAWYPGQNGGTAVADILFGNYNPSGRLPITFYRSTKDLPDFQDYSMANRTYRFFEGQPLYAFGYGLSYTQFDYGKLQVSENRMPKTGSVHVTLPIKNSGPRAGDEVVQLYVKHLSSPVPQPKHSLAGFKRIPVEKGETKTVDFALPASALRYWNEEKNEYVIPSGAFEVQVGSSSDNIHATAKITIE